VLTPQPTALLLVLCFFARTGRASAAETPEAGSGADLLPRHHLSAQLTPRRAWQTLLSM